MRVNGDYDVAVIGGGPAGMAAAIAAAREGARVLILERNDQLGGILPQCIHNGFGAINFGRDLPGPEYAYRYEQKVRALPVEIKLNTMVLDVTGGRDVFAINDDEGYLHFKPKSIVMAMGCRERTRAQIRLPGTRAAGIFTAGTVQRLVNIEGYMPGRRVVVLGSGDIGMIMARRLTIEGATVLSVLELMPHLTGLRRNYVQCLQDYDIPLHLSTTVKKIKGKRRVEGIETIQVDERFRPIAGTERSIDCDTLVLSVGLIPENELSSQAGVVLDDHTRGPRIDSSMATSVPGIFAAGNVTGIYDLVDYVSIAGTAAGANAAAYARGTAPEKRRRRVRLVPGSNVGSILPQEIEIGDDDSRPTIMLRPNATIDVSVRLRFTADDETVTEFRERYARPSEMIVKTLSARHLDQLRGDKNEEYQVEIV